MKKLLLLLVAALMASSVSAGVVDEAAAKRKAQKFLTERATAELRKANPGSKAVATNVKVELVETRTTADGTPALYTFNARDGKGFVMIPANDVYGEVLGFSATGTIDPENMPPALEALLTRFAANASDDGWYKVPYYERDTLLLHPIDSMKPLVQTRWSQGAPYNLQTPTFLFYNTGDGTYDMHGAPTGCVGTAMAQLLYWHHYNNGISFDVTSTVPSYTTKIDFSDDSVINKLDTDPATLAELQSKQYNAEFDWANKKLTVYELAPTAFEWDKMQLTYDDNSDSIARLAVAKLMRYCGQAIKMDYAPDGSSSFTRKLCHGLNEYFNIEGYKAYYYYGRHFLFQDFQAKVMYEVATKGRPVVLGGVGSAGHEFVLDGVGYLQENSQDVCYHFNWGWSGVSDGWFRMELLNPGLGNGSNINFSEELDLMTLAPNDEQSIHSSDVSTFKSGVAGTSLDDPTLEYKYALTDSMMASLFCLTFTDVAASATIYPVALRIDDSHNAQSTASPVGEPCVFSFDNWEEDTVNVYFQDTHISYSDVMQYMNKNKLDTCMVGYAMSDNGTYKVLSGELYAFYFIATANRDSVIIRPNVWNVGEQTLDSISVEIDEDNNYTVSIRALRLQNIIPKPVGATWRVSCDVDIYDGAAEDTGNSIMPLDDDDDDDENLIVSQSASYQGYLTGNKLLYVCFPSQARVWKEPLADVTEQDTVRFTVTAENRQVIYRETMSLKDLFKQTALDDVTIVPVTIVDDAIYDLNGRRLPVAPEQGVYIRGGKKYLTR